MSNSVITTAETLTALSTLTGEDLLRVGRDYGKIARGQKNLDKGWANRVVRASLLDGCDPEDAPLIEPDLRVVPLGIHGDHAKHALSLCSVDFSALSTTPFTESRLHSSLANVVLIGREDEKVFEKVGLRRRSRVLATARFAIGEHSLLEAAISRDYDLLSRKARRGEDINASSDGKYIQVRTKGTGHTDPADRTFAFYARPNLIALMLGLNL